MANYYVKNGGSDGAAGTSDATAWATLAKVSGYTFSPGDNVYFKCGSTWRERLVNDSAGSNGNPVTFTKYGTGDLPRIWPSWNKSSTSDWTNQGSNMWRSAFTHSLDIGNLIFNYGTAFGIKRDTYALVTAQGNFYKDSGSGYLYVYSTSNPASYYSDIEVAISLVSYGNDSSAIAAGADYQTYSYFDIRYSGGDALFCYGVNHITFEYIQIRCIGGLFLRNTERYGNALTIWNSATYITVRYCYVNNTYDTGVTPQGDGNGSAINHIYIHHNIFMNTEFSFELWYENANQTLSHIYFENNTCLYGGGSWAHTQRDDSGKGQHLTFYTSTSAANNIYIRNNIFSEATDRIAWWRPWNDIENVTMTNNCYYKPTGGYVVVFTYPDRNYTAAQFAAYQATEGLDENSFYSNPGFVSSSDYHLAANSACRGAGVDCGYTVDYEGNPITGTPDVGAYAYTSTNSDSASISPSSSVSPSVSRSISSSSSASSSASRSISPSSSLSPSPSSSLSPSFSVSPSISPSVPANLFNIDFSTGDLTQFTTTATDGGDLFVAAGAALAGTNYGLNVLVNDVNPKYGQKDITCNTNTFRLRFYLDPNSLTMGASDFFTISTVQVGTTSSELHRINLFNSNGYNIQVGNLNDDASEPAMSSVPISDAPHCIEILSIRETTSSSNDGVITLWVDGTQSGTLTNLANYATWGNHPKLWSFGAIYGLDAGTSGTFYIDEIVVNDSGDPIGMLGSSSASASISPSSSASRSLSPSSSASSSVSPSTSRSLSPSSSVSPSASSSASRSISPSSSVSPSASRSVSPSVSPSASSSTSPSSSASSSASSSSSSSLSPSSSNSPSISPSSSNSNSLSPSSSVSQSPSTSMGASNSPSPSLADDIVGSVTWGQQTGVVENNAISFVDHWWGTAYPSGVGDSEVMSFESGQYTESGVVITGIRIVELLMNHYSAGDIVALKYKNGNSKANCLLDSWTTYTDPFNSLGYVQIRLERV